MKKLGLGIVLALSSIALPAYADDAVPAPSEKAPSKEAAPNFRGASTVPDVIITGRRSIPLASVSILRLEPAITLAELRISLLAKVEKVILGDHF